MQVLVTEFAHAKIAGRLAALGPDLDVLTVDATGAVKRAGAPVAEAEIDPEVFWITQEMYSTGQLPGFFGRMMGGTRGRWAQSFTAGLDNPAFKQLIAKGFRISKSSAQAPPIAEYVMAHALSALHPIAAQREAQAAGQWKRTPFREVADTRWVLVGYGAIGKEIAKRLQPFGAHLSVVRRNAAPEPLADEVRPTSDLIGLLPEADVVVLACALNESTRGIAGEDFFQAMKPGALLTNIARGALIQDAALKAGLDRDQPGLAVLDVFDPEPLPADAWQWSHPKVRVTGHTCNAGSGVEGRSGLLFLENLRRYRAGEPLLNEAKPSEVGL